MPTACSSARSASPACSPPPPIRNRPVRFPTCDARSTRSCTAPASIRRDIPVRRWSTCWRITRATNCSRSTRIRSISSRCWCCSSTNGRECESCRAATGSIASSRCWCSCRASVTTAACASRSAATSPRSTRDASAPSIRSFPRDRWSGSISSSRGSKVRRRHLIASAWSGRSRRWCAPGPTSSATSSQRCMIRRGRAPCSNVIAMLSRTDTAKTIRRSRRWPISGSSRGCRQVARSVSIFTVAHRARAVQSLSRCGATNARSRSPSACRCSSTWASRW